MKIDMNITEHDKKLLAFLAVVVIASALVFLGIRPLYVAIQTNTEAYDREQELQAINKVKEADYSGLKERYSEAQNHVAESLTGYYSIMKSEEIDRMLTGMALQYGLAAKDLSISMPQGECNLQPYMYSDTDGTSKNIGTVSSGSSSGSTSGNTSSGQTDDSELSTGVYAASVSMKLEGDKARMEKLINELSTQYQSLRVTAYSWTTENSAAAISVNSINISTTDVLNISLEIYMCDK